MMIIAFCASISRSAFEFNSRCTSWAKLRLTVPKSFLGLSGLRDQCRTTYLPNSRQRAPMQRRLLSPSLHKDAVIPFYAQHPLLSTEVFRCCGSGKPYIHSENFVLR